jgi:hypothetical protein
MKPISPSEVKAFQESQKIDSIISEINSRLRNGEKTINIEVTPNQMIDVADSFKSYGWDVYYSRGGGNTANFTFRG